MIKFKLINSKIFKNFFISYLIVFILPLILIFASLYRINTNIVKEEIYSANNNSLVYYKNALDYKIERIKSINYLLDNNHNLTSLISVKNNEFTSESHLAAWEFLKDIYPYRLANSFIDYIYIYSNNSDYIITDNNTNNQKNIFDEIHNANDETILFEEWNKLMRKRHNGELMSFSKEENKDLDEKNYVYYIQSLPMYYSKDIEANSVVRFDFAKEIKMNKEFFGQVIIYIDEFDNLLYSTNINIPMNVSFSNLENEKGVFTKEGFFVNYVKTSQVKGAFISITEEEIVFEELNNTKVLAWLILMFCMVLGGGLTYYFTVHNYNPIQKLISITKQFSNSGQNSINTVENLTEINLALMEAMDEKLTYQNYYMENRRSELESEFLKLLNKKNIDGNQLKIILDKIGLNLVEDYFIMLKVTLTDYSQVFFESIDDVKESNLKPLQAYKNLYEEVIKRRGRDIELEESNHLIMTKDNALIIVIGAIKKEERTNRFLKDIVNNIYQFMRDNFAIDSFTAISAYHKGEVKLYDAYKEIDEISEYFNLVGIGNMMSFDEINRSSIIKNLENTTIIEEKLLLGNIKNGEFEKGQEILDDIFKKYFFDQIKSPQIIKFRMFSLANNIIDTIIRLEIPNIDNFIEEMHPFSRILDCKNAKKLHCELTILLNEIDMFFKREENNVSLELKNKIIYIVEQNYKDPNINVSFVAQATGKSLDYISRYFKKTTRIGLLDYIHSKRIDEAKKMLREKVVSINEIAQIVGYTNTDSFIRVFKKMEGMTPGKFRKSKS